MHNLGRKVCTFLFQIKDESSERRNAFVRSLQSDQGKRRKAGETMLLLIEQSDRMEKLEIIGKLCRAAIQEYIAPAHALRVSFMVNNSYLDDLHELLAMHDHFASSTFNVNLEHEIVEAEDEGGLALCQRLAASGLLFFHMPTSQGDEVYRDSQRQTFCVSTSGKILLRHALLPETERCSHCFGEGNRYCSTTHAVVSCDRCAGLGRILPERVS